MKKRILILPSWYPDPLHPLNGIFIHEQAVALSKRYDVVVLDVQAVRWWRLLGRQIGVATQAGVMDDIPVHVERSWILVPRTPWVFYKAIISATRRGLDHIIHTMGRPDLLHAHVVLPMGYAAVEVGHEYGIPIVLTEHTSPFSVHLKTKYQRRVVAETLRGVNKVLAVSPSLSKTIQTFAPEVIPGIVGNLVRTDFFTPVSSSTRLPTKSVVRFLTVGFLVEQKGITILLDAVAILRGKGLTEFQVVIAGDGILRTALEKQAENLNSHCKFLGLLSRKQVRDEMRQSDVFILPSLHETFGIVLAEAMACGKPVIATRCGGPEYVVSPETGVLVEPGNPKALADAMERFMLGHVQFSAETIRQSVVNRFGEDVFLDNMSAIYNNIMLKPSG